MLKSHTWRKSIHSQNFQAFLVLLLGFNVAACSRPETSEFVVAVPGEITTFDWSRATDSVSKGVLENLVPRLMRFRSEGLSAQVEPGLLKSLTPLDDSGKTWSLELRSGVTWTDGASLHAEHVIHGLSRNALAQTKSACFQTAKTLFGESSENFTQVFSPIGERTIRVSLKVAYPNLPRELTKLCYSPSRNMLFDEDKKLISLGPFELKSYEPGRKLTLDRRTKSQLVDTLQIKMNIDPATAIDLFEAEKVDMVPWVPGPLIRRAKKHRKLVAKPAIRTTFLVLNTGTDAFASVGARRSFSKRLRTIDLKPVLDEFNEPTQSLVPELLYPSKSSSQTMAAEELEQAQSYEVLTHKSDFSLRWLQRLQFELKKKKVTLSIRALDWKSYLAEMTSTKSHLLRMSWATETLDSSEFLKIFTSEAKENRSGWSSKDFDMAYQSALNAKSANEKARAIGRALKILIDLEFVVIPLFESKTVQLISPKFEGFNENPLMNYDFSKLKRK